MTDEPNGPSDNPSGVGILEAREVPDLIGPTEALGAVREAFAHMGR